MIAYVTRKLRLTMLRQSSRKSTAKAPTESSAITIKSINGSVMSIVYFQSFCRVYQASGKGQSLYLIVTDYTPFGVMGQTIAIYFWQSKVHSHRNSCNLPAN